MIVKLIMVSTVSTAASGTAARDNNSRTRDYRIKLIVFPAVLFLIFSLMNSVQATTACRDRNSSLTIFCNGVINWKIPAESNDELYDELAESSVADITACPLYRSTEFYCRRFFPICRNVSGTIVVTKMCTSYCMEAKLERDSLCAGFSNAYYRSVCANTTFMSANNADCFSLDLWNDAASKTWRWVIFGALIAGGVVLLLHWLYKRYQESHFDPSASAEVADEEEFARQQDARDQASANDGYADIAGANDFVGSGQRQPVTMEDRERAWKSSQPRAQENG